MFIMSVFGISMVLILGVINFLLLLFQLLSGLRYIKLKIKVHKTIGIILFITGTLHGILAALANL